MLKVLIIASATAILASACSPRTASDSSGAGTTAAATTYSNDWSFFSAEGGLTNCSDYSPYFFLVRRADPNKIAVIFQGGGACWDEATCSSGSQTFKRSVSEADSPQAGQGIFDFGDDRNPIADFTTVFIPYCTADAHLGDTVATYAAGSEQETTISHRGYANAATALSWVLDHVEEPETIFVAGMSAGAIASPFYAGLLASIYPDTKVVQLGDGAGGYRHETIPTIMDTWGATELTTEIEWLETMNPDTLDFEDLYIAAGQFPNLQLAQVNYVDDAVQVSFLQKMGSQATGLNNTLTNNLAEIEQAIPTFRAYQIPGNLHVVIDKPEFYSTEIEGVKLSDWLTALLEQDTASNVGSQF
ncbi:MAG: pectin acetylesterase-family hydrolase [Cyanobacteria bacterium P01_H01_bin.121]